jgi:hypothetical protein
MHVDNSIMVRRLGREEGRRYDDEYQYFISHLHIHLLQMCRISIQQKRKKGYFLVMVHSSFDSDDQPGDPFSFSDLVLTQNDIFSIQICGNGFFFYYFGHERWGKKKKSISNQNSRGKKNFNFAKSRGI